MQLKHSEGVISPKTEYSFVYYYLLAGITLLVAVFLFLPRVSIG